MGGELRWGAEEQALCLRRKKYNSPARTRLASLLPLPLPPPTPLDRRRCATSTGESSRRRGWSEAGCVPEQPTAQLRMPAQLWADGWAALLL